MRFMLTALFYLVATPLGLVLRLFGYDPLRLRGHTRGSAFVDREHHFRKSDFEHL